MSQGALAARRHDDQIDIFLVRDSGNLLRYRSQDHAFSCYRNTFQTLQARFQEACQVKARLAQDAIDRPAFATGSHEGKILGM